MLVRVDDEAMAEAMKGKGLGTPATRADTIEKIDFKEFYSKSKIR